MLVEMGCLGGIETSGSGSSQEEVCRTEEKQQQDGTHTHTHTGILLSHKKEQIGPFAEMWMDLESVT